MYQWSYGALFVVRTRVVDLWYTRISGVGFFPPEVWFLVLKIGKFFYFLHMVLAADTGDQVLLFGVFLIANIIYRANSLFRHQSVEQNFLHLTGQSVIETTNFSRDSNVQHRLHWAWLFSTAFSAKCWSFVSQGISCALSFWGLWESFWVKNPVPFVHSCCFWVTPHTHPFVWGTPSFMSSACVLGLVPGLHIY